MTHPHNRFARIQSCRSGYAGQFVRSRPAQSCRSGYAGRFVRSRPAQPDLRAGRMTMKPITVCPICGSRKVERVRENRQCSTRHGKVTVRNLDVDHCRHCGESFYDFEASQKIDTAIAASKGRKSA